MKLILMLLLFSLSLSCFSQENDRATILKNKVRYVRIKANQSDSISSYIEYNKYGLIVKSIEPSTIFINLNKVSIYNYIDTLLKSKIETIHDRDSLYYTDTTYYEYDNKGRLLIEFEPEINENSRCYVKHSGRLNIYSYLDSISKNIYKIKYYDSNEEYYKNNCSITYKDHYKYYLKEYEILKYIPTQSEPVIYRFNEYEKFENIKRGMYRNSSIENEIVRIWDTLYRFESRYTVFDSSFIKNGLLCDMNEFTGTGKSLFKTELKTYRNSKVVKNVTENSGGFKYVSFQLYYYNDYGLISNIVCTYRDGVSSQYSQPLFNEFKNVYKYQYEYFK